MSTVIKLYSIFTAFIYQPYEPYFIGHCSFMSLKTFTQSQVASVRPLNRCLLNSRGCLGFRGGGAFVVMLICFYCHSDPFLLPFRTPVHIAQGDSDTRLEGQQN